jgi:hypothetical protein
VFLEVSGRRARGNGAQSMLIWLGIRLYGCTSAAKAVRNGCLYTVESIDPEAQTLVLEGVGSLAFDQARAWLRLSYARTYASCQGPCLRIRFGSGTAVTATSRGATCL